MFLTEKGYVMHTVVRRLIGGLLFIVGSWLVLSNLFGCTEQRETPRQTNQDAASKPLSMDLPKPTVMEVLFISRRLFHLVDSGKIHIIRSAQLRGNTFFLLEDRSTLIGRHLEVQGDQCYYRPRKALNPPTVATTIDLNGGQVDVQAFEISCSIWQYSPTITLAQNIFPSDLETETGTTRVYVDASPIGRNAWSTLERLGQQGSWVIHKSRGEGHLVAQASDELTPEIEILEGESTETALEPIGSFLEASLQLARTVKSVGALELKTPSEFAALMRSKTIAFRSLSGWFDELSPEDQVMLIKRFAPALAKLMVQMVDQGLLERYVTSLEWTKDILSVDPRWMKDWPHHDEEKAVAYFNNLSLVDVEVRLFWARRGLHHFALVRDAVLKEMKGRQAQR